MRSALVVVTLLCTVVQSLPQPEVLDLELDHGVSQWTECCFRFYPRSIPLRHIKSAVRTPPHCVLQGLIVTTTKNRKICVSPDRIRLPLLPLLHETTVAPAP